MRGLIAIATAVAALVPAGASHARAAAPCAGQIHPNASFERGAAGWTAGPRIIVLGDAHTGRAYATFGGLDVTHSDLLRSSTVTIPADCNLTVGYWVRTTTTETSAGDRLNVGMSVSGWPPKTVRSLAYDGSAQWYRYTQPIAATTTDRTAAFTFAASESAGNGVTTFDLDDVTFTLS